MSPLRAFTYFAVFLLLLGYYVIVEREAPLSEAAATPVPKRWLDVAAVDVAGVLLRAGPAELQVRKSEGRWYVSGPLQQPIPADLVPSLLDSLLATEPVEILGKVGDRLAEFGLDRDERSIELSTDDGRLVKVRLGYSNPARTAVYASVAGSDEVALLGLNVDYYFTLGISGVTGESRVRHEA